MFHIYSYFAKRLYKLWRLYLGIAQKGWRFIKFKGICFISGNDKKGDKKSAPECRLREGVGRWKAIWTMPKKTGYCLWGPYLKLFGALKWVRVAKNLFVLRPCRHHILSEPTSIYPHFQWHNLQGLQTRTNIKKEMKTDFKFPRTTPTSCLSDWSVCNWPSRTSFLELMSSLHHFPGRW